MRIVDKIWVQIGEVKNGVTSVLWVEDSVFYREAHAMKIRMLFSAVVVWTRNRYI